MPPPLPPNADGRPRSQPVYFPPVLAVASVVCMVLGLTISEGGHNAWHSVHAWGALAIAGAALPLAPSVTSLPRLVAWRLAVAGAVLLVLFWVLFVLPVVGSNLSLVLTVGAAAGVAAAWLTPGPPAPEPGARPGPSRRDTW